MGLTEYAIKVARRYYDDKTFYHAMRVAAYTTENNLIREHKVDRCVALAIMHDLLEDTGYISDDKILDDDFIKCLNILTKREGESYEDYLKNIRNNYDCYPEAYWVKQADMKDHLMQKETLTDELKDKYLNAMPELL